MDSADSALNARSDYTINHEQERSEKSLEPESDEGNLEIDLHASQNERNFGGQSFLQAQTASSAMQPVFGNFSHQPITAYKAENKLGTAFVIIYELLCTILSSVLTVYYLQGCEKSAKFSQLSSEVVSLESGHFGRKKWLKESADISGNNKLENIKTYKAQDFNTMLSQKGLLPLSNFWGHLIPSSVAGTIYPVSRQKGDQGERSDRQGHEQEQSSPGEESPLGNEEWPPQTVNGLPWATYMWELYRAGTFYRLPITFPISALKLAQAGFLHLSNSTIVCFFCGLRRDAWMAGESPMEVHRQLRPNCPILTGADCDNQVVTATPSGEQLREMLQNLSLNVPMPLQGAEGGQEVAAAEATGLEGAVGGSTNQNSHRDSQPTAAQPSPPKLGLKGGAASVANPSPQGVPEAPVLDGTAQLDPPRPERSPAPTEIKRQVVTYEQLGIITAEPKHPNMAMVDKRAGSYRNWPSDSACTPLELSEAGYFYAGYSDCGRCFFCGGALRNWEPDDNPWVEHARWFPKCAYIKLCQGQDFIDIVQELNAEGDEPQITVAQINAEVSKRRAAGDRIQEPAVDSAIVSVLQLGFSQGAVDCAVRNLQREGHVLTADRLVDYLPRDLPEMNGDLGLDFDAEPAEIQDQVASLVEQNSNIRQQQQCKICVDKEVCIAFLPCGHLSCCAECSPALRNCPVCRTTVKGRVRTYPD